jgi:hypothetical protein
MIDSRDKVLEMVEEGYISSDQALLMCLKWMSQDDVDGIIKANELDVYPLTVEEYENADVIMDNVEVE